MPERKYEEVYEKIDVTGLNDAVLAIQKSFNTGERKHVEHAVNILNLLLQHEFNEEKISIIRADKFENTTQDDFLKTGVADLDTVLGKGLRKGELFSVIAESGNGKTHVLAYIAGNFVKNGLTLLHITLEDQLSDIDNIYGRMLQDEKYREHIYYVDITSGFTLKAIEKILEETEVKPDVVVIDHLDAMQMEGKDQNWIELGKIVTRLRYLAKKHNCIILTGSQGTKGQNGNIHPFGSTTGKNGPTDVSFIIKNNIDNTLFIQIGKFKSRSARTRNFVMNLNFDTMEATFDF